MKQGFNGKRKTLESKIRRTLQFTVLRPNTLKLKPHATRLLSMKRGLHIYMHRLKPLFGIASRCA